MASALVDAAVQGLEALGLPITPSTPYLIDLLIQQGEDPLTSFPRLVHTIEQLGGNSWQVLEEVAGGMLQYGPVNYVQRAVEKYCEPQVQKVQEIQRHKSVLTAQHRATLQQVQNHLATLQASGQQVPTNGSAFTGVAASAMTDSLAELSAHFDKLMTAMDDSQQIDRDLQIDLQHAVDLIAAMLIVDLLLFIIVFIVIFVGSQLVLLVPEVALAPETGGVSLAAGGGVSLGGAAAIAGGMVVALLPVEGTIVLATLLYAFGRWAVRHAMLEMAQPTAASHVFPLVSSKPILPEQELTPEDAQFANDLFKELGGAVPEKTLQYLVKMLGVSKLSAAMIRCLYQNGYLDLSGYMGNKGKQLADANTSAWININDHLDPNDLEGAWKEANPSEVDPTTIPPGSKFVSGGDHETEVNDGLNGIGSLIDNLKNVITIFNNRIAHASDPKAPNVLDMIDKRTRLQKLEDAFTTLRDFVRSKVGKGSPSPDRWSDQGKLPIVEDLLQTSTCKVPDAKYYR